MSSSREKKESWKLRRGRLLLVRREKSRVWSSADII
jgi:hypothetical protein